MKRTPHELTAFKVQQAIGSMAIEGIQVSKVTRQAMEDVAAGRTSAHSLKRQLIEKYRQSVMS